MKPATVSIVRCETYHEEEVLRGLRRSIDLLGGIETFVKRGDRVLLKPNLLYGKAPEKAVTTHPSVVRGMIKIVREAGGVPLIGDSPGMESLGRAAEKAGIKRVADETGCPLVEFDRPIVPSERRGRRFKQLEVDRSVLEADVIINLPKWKTHGQVLLTLGVKNLFGCIPGPRKALWHLKAGQDQKLFARMLIDVYLTVRPALTILDGIVGMDGNGPGSGRPFPLGLLLGARDPLHLDQIVCDLLGIRRELLPTNRVAFESGIGMNEIEVVGENVEEVKISGFQLPPLSDLGWSLPGFLKRALRKALTGRPVIDEEVCKICGRCEEICPPKALTQEGHLALDEQKCIRCFCCQEICPEGAISIKPGWVQRIVRSKA